MTDPFNGELHSELIIGLVNAVGTENKLVIDLLKERLGRAGYSVVSVKVSNDVIPLLYDVPPHGDDQFKRISDLMDAGNEARATAKNDSVLALGVAAWISARRASDKDESPLPLPKTAVIVDSLKRPEEVEQLRLIYPSGFILIGVHADVDRRRRHLAEDRGMTVEKANELIRRDGEESKVDHGQRVNKTFHMADFFVEISDNYGRLRGDVQRMVELWFGNPFITPTFDEHAMFLAFAAALRSADLSRQVGAVVTRDSQILSTGANDCPKAGGGLYWPIRHPDSSCIDDTPHGRDYLRPEGDTNREEQIRIISQIVEEGKKAEYGLDEEKLRALLSKSRISDLTEFGRVVHAEMEALLCCSRNGLSTVGTTLYSTTFPCHNCAKHIIASGVERGVYVEPYPKSKALQYHDDSITTVAEKASGVEGRVKFEAFVGIGPRRFFDLFSMDLGSSYPLIRKIKETGKKKEWRIEESQLRIKMSPVSYLELELQACTIFGKAQQPHENQEENHEREGSPPANCQGN